MFALIGSALGVFPFVSLSNILLRMWGGVAVDPVLVSVPMFIFMGTILERSGSAKDSPRPKSVEAGARSPCGRRDGDGHDPRRADRRGRGGGRAALGHCAAKMLASGYNKHLAIGTIASAGTLGILIPPAIMLVVMAEMLNTSSGALFAAATIPGFLLSGIYLVYIHLAIIKPEWAPNCRPTTDRKRARSSGTRCGRASSR